jgi:nitrite reductase/ring-hydroxylating ferredoxin subunit
MFFAAKLAEVPLCGKMIVTVNGFEVVLNNDKGRIFAARTYVPTREVQCWLESSKKASSTFLVTAGTTS